jgi:hypothetical protein
MGNTNYDKELKKSFDVLEQGLIEIDSLRRFNKYSTKQKYVLSYIVNSILEKSDNLNLNHKKRYLLKVKNNNLIDCMLSDTIKRKLKKIYYKFKYKL